MNKIITILIGIFMISIALNAIITGETSGFSSGKAAGYPVFYNSDPIEFTLNTLLSLGIGIWLLKCGIFNNSEEKTTTAKTKTTNLAPKRR